MIVLSKENLKSVSYPVWKKEGLLVVANVFFYKSRICLYIHELVGTN